MPKGKIAYLSPEFALSDELPIYAGGLGVLAADILYQASDLDLPLVGVTLFYPAGCFHQRVDSEGNVREECIRLDPQKAGLAETGVTVVVPFPDRKVHLKVWKKVVGKAALYFLDANTPENSERDREMAYRLYDGRVWPPHIERDALLGVGGVRALRKLGEDILIWHINDDHTSFSLLERIRELMAEGKSLASARAEVKKETVFTTHTPDLGAESAFPLEEAGPYLETLFQGLPVSAEEVLELGAREVEGRKLFSLTVFSMRHSRVTNAVSRAHQEVSRRLWSFVWPDLPLEEVPITHVTNGIYPKRWVAGPLASLYEQYLSSDWERETDDPALWEKVEEVPDSVLWRARREAKEALVADVYRRTGKKLDPEALILGFARRLVEYKQPALLISDLSRLASILCSSNRPAYLLMAGKVHPQDAQGKELVRTLVRAPQDPRLGERLIFLENYGLGLAQLLVSGSDVWLNTPLPGREACGTSGMKALYNGVLHASTLDGWWAEAYDGKNGWAIEGPDFAASLYRLLEEEIAPLYYQRDGNIPKAWLKKVREAIASLAPRFTTARMLKEYAERLYFPSKQGD